MSNPYRDMPPPRLVRLKGVGAWVHPDDVVSVSVTGNKDEVTIRFRNGQKASWSTEEPEDLAQGFVDSINGVQE